jgi:hypothetical protein
MIPGQPPRFSANIARLLETLPDFEERFANAPDRYDTLRSDRHRAVTRWDWYTFHHFHLDPMFFVLDECLAPGRKLKRDPKGRNGKTRYGIDSSGSVLVGETYNEFPGRCGEEFREYGNAWIDSTLYTDRPAKDCINVARLFLADGRAHACMTYAAAGFGISIYEWQDDQIVRVEECRTGFSRDPGERPLERVDYAIRYTDGRPSSVTKTVTTADTTVEYLISYDAAGRKKARILKSPSKNIAAPRA